MLNIGSGNFVDGYFGDRYSSSAYSGGYSSYGNSSNNRVASSANLNRVSRDLSQGYGQDIDIMSDYFNEGNTTQALKLYNELFENTKETAQDYGYDLTDKQIRSTLNSAFQARTGMKLSDQASSHSKSSFMTGLLEGIPLLGWIFADANSSADARATIEGKYAPSGIEVAKEVAGAALGSAAGIAGLSALDTLGVAEGALKFCGLAKVAAGAGSIMGASTIFPIALTALAIGAGVVAIKHALSK